MNDHFRVFPDQPFPVYTFSKDSGHKSACTGQCALDRPPVLTSGKPETIGYLAAELHALGAIVCTPTAPTRSPTRASPCTLERGCLYRYPPAPVQRAGGHQRRRCIRLRRHVRRDPAELRRPTVVRAGRFQRLRTIRKDSLPRREHTESPGRNQSAGAFSSPSTPNCVKIQDSQWLGLRPWIRWQQRRDCLPPAGLPTKASARLYQPDWLRANGGPVCAMSGSAHPHRERGDTGLARFVGDNLRFSPRALFPSGTRG